MKKKYKAIIKYLGLCLIFLLISIFVDYFVFNFKQFQLKDNEKGIIKISDYTLSKIDESNCIKISFDDIFINKLKINYSTDVDIPISIKYSELDYYGEKKNTEINDKLDDEVNEWINNFSNKISEVNIFYDEDIELNVNSIFIDNSFNLNFFRIFYVFVFLNIIWLLYHFYKNGADSALLHKYFVILAFIIGTCFIILQPSTTFYSYDDQIHFLNSYELIGGDLQWSIGEFSMISNTAVGRGSIDSIEEQINQLNYLNINKKVEYSTYGSHFITYNRIAYIPSAIGYHVCDKLGLPFVICFKVGKILNLLAYVLIMGYAIKISKVGKRLLTVIGLLPSVIFLASQYSYDPAVISGLTLGIAVLMNWFIDKESKVDFKSMLTFIIAMLYGCFPKAIYIPFILLFLFVPNEKFSNKKYRIFTKIGIVVVCLLVLSTFVSPSTLSTEAGGDSRGGNTNSGEQLKLIISNPIGYVRVLKDTFVGQFSTKIIGTDTLGQYAYMGIISQNLYYLTLIILLFVGFTDTSKKSLITYQRVFIISISIGIMLLIWTALYLSFTPVGMNTINGVQSRYFIPLMFPIVMAIQSPKIKNGISMKFYNSMLLITMSLILLISIYQLVLTVYCF